MAKNPIFALLDTAANAFGNPFVVPHVGVAVRELSQAVNANDPQIIVSQHPQDFTLYQIGEYDTTTGVITAPERPVLIQQAASLKQSA